MTIFRFTIGKVGEDLPCLCNRQRQSRNELPRTTVGLAQKLHREPPKLVWVQSSSAINMSTTKILKGRKFSFHRDSYMIFGREMIANCLVRSSHFNGSLSSLLFYLNGKDPGFAWDEATSRSLVGKTETLLTRGFKKDSVGEAKDAPCLSYRFGRNQASRKPLINFTE